MFDIKALRTNPDFFDDGHKKRGLKAFSKDVLSLDVEHRDIMTRLQTLQAERNKLSKDFGLLKSKNEDTTELSARIDDIKKNMQTLETESKTIEKDLHDLLSAQPNTPDEKTPEGLDETFNVCIKTVGTPRKFSFDPKPHYEIGENLEQMDFEQAARVAGSRFVYLKADLARLERALSAFMLDTHTEEFGYTEISPPLLVHDTALFGTAQLPKFHDDLFQTTKNHWLISTAEISLTNIVMEKVLQEKELPMRIVAYTPCFRSEAGAAGRDTRGMIRLHQFHKVELVTIATEDQAEKEFDHMLNAAETILQRLDLPYRVMHLCAGDMGFSARKTYDIEVWVPAQNTYREISSCSQCGDFQSRRMNARYKLNNGGKPSFVHTMNGSGLPTGRTLVAILENYQNEDGSVEIPMVLQPYMNNKKRIIAK